MKNIFTYLRNRRFPEFIKTSSLLFLFSLITKLTLAQTVTFDLVKVPCHNDGILVIQTSGVNPPIVFGIYQGNGVFTEDTINGTTDTLKNYSGGFVSMSAEGIGSTGAQGFYNGAPPFLFSIERGPAVCPKLGYAKAVIDSGGTAPFQVQWYNPGSTNVVATGDSVGLPPGYYNILITDAKGCTYGSYSAYDSLYIYSISPIHLNTATTTANCTNGSATLSNPNGGIAPYTYHWSNGANTPSISGLITGDYAFTVTDAQGCVNDSDVVVPQSVTIDVNTTPHDATCIQSDGSDIAFGTGGNSPYTYLWNTGQATQAISNLVSGYYFVTATDSHGCIGSNLKYSYVAASTPITVTYSATASSCTSATGTATINITGGTPSYSIKWNTFPAQTTTTATGLNPGLYGFQVTDAVGCVQSGSVYVPPISVITAYAFASDAFCTQSNGEANVVITGGAAPFAYLWSNGGTDASIAGLPSGGYSCKITDNLGCSVNKFASIGRSSPIGLSFTTTQASCLYTSDATVTVAPFGGTAPYTYNWSGGQTTATATGLSQGNYYSYVSDAAGCVQNGFTYAGYDASNNSCYCTITGTVYDDQNSNCAMDAGDAGIQNIMVHLSGLGYTYTDQNGNYSFLAPTGSYTLSEDVEYYYPLASCQNNSMAVNVTAGANCTSTYNFANVINPIHDVSIYTCSYCKPPIPGNVYQQYVVIKNNGTITEDSILSTYGDDGQLSTATFSPALFNSVASNYYSTTPGSFSLTPGASQVFNVDYNVPTNIPLGTQVNFNDSAAYHSPIANWLSDYSPWNNVSAYQNAVVGSFDPNNKEVSPIGIGTPGYINTTSDSMLTYTIHFQNTGSYQAQKVVVVDTLDSHLDMTTLRPGYSNHTYSTKISENGVLTFTFDNINLPDSTTSSLGSIGIVSYSIRQKAGNTNGTQIKSPASIYFDFNAPVRTNTPLNTIQTGTGIKENTASILDLVVYPNPASSGSVSLLINTNSTSTVSTVGIYNLLGKLVQSQTVNLNTGRNIVSADVSQFTPGLYFVRVDEGQKSLIQKLTIVR